MNGISLYRILLVIVCLHVAATAASQNSVDRSDMDKMEKLTVSYPDSAYSILKNRLVVARSVNNKLLEGYCLEYLGEVFYHMGSYAKAMENLQAAEKIFKDQKETGPLAKTLNYLGNVYAYNGQSAFAFARYKEALALYNQAGDYKGLTETYGQIGFIYEKKHDYDSAIYFQQVALKEPIEPADSLVKAKIYENLGSIMEDKSKYDSAMFFFMHASELNRRFNNPLAQIEILNNLGDIYRKTGKIDKGLPYTRQALQLARELGEKYQLQSACWDMAKTFKLLKRFDSALYYTEESKTLQHKIYTAESARQIAFMRTIYDIERKDAELARLNAAQRISYAVTVAVVVICMLLILLIKFIMNKNSWKIKNERIIHENRQMIQEAEHALIKADLSNKQLEENNLRSQLELKSKVLSSHLLHLIQKNEVLETLRSDLTELIKDDKRDQKKQLRAILQKINVSFSQDNYWEEFRLIFDQVHKQFFTDLQKLSADLSVSELRMLSLIKMNLSSHEISTLLGITPDSVRVTKYRIKKKLNRGTEESLTSFIQAL